MDNAMKIPIPTDPQIIGSIEQKLSRINGEKRNSIEWKITSLFCIHCNKWPHKKFVSENFTLLDDDEDNTLTWCLALVGSPGELSQYFSTFPCFLPENHCKEANVKIKLSILDKERKKLCVANFSEICCFDASDQSTSAYLYFNAFFTGDPFIVVCDIIQSDLPKFSLSKDLENVFENQDSNSSDITLVSNDGKIHKAHEIILASRSSVFAAMFKHKMKENRQHEVKIEDMNGEVVEEMLRYMYSGRTKKLKHLTKDLLVAADKYDLKGLKIMCEETILSTLTVFNAVEMLQFSDLYNADRLKSEIVNFIIMEENVEVIYTESWKRLEESSFHLLKIICEASMSRNRCK